MWMKRYGWDAICRDSDGGGGGSGGTSAAEAAMGLGTFDETSGPTGSPGTGTGPGTGPGPSGGAPGPNVGGSDRGGSVGSGGSGGPGSASTASPAPEPESESSVSRGLNAISRELNDPQGRVARGILGLISGPLGFVATIGAVGKGLAEEFGGSVGPPGAEPGAAGAGPGGEADEADRALIESRRFARSDRSVDRDGAPTQGVSRTPAPAPTFDLPSSDIDEIRAELDAEREARRRRRRTTRQSTIVTGPLGVPGRPELLQPTATAGASRRLLGQ